MNFTPPPGLTLWPAVDKWTEIEWSHWLAQHGWTQEQADQYLQHDRYAYGIGFTPAGERAGPHNAHDDGVKWLYLPTPKGCTLHATRDSGVSNILWGGAVGGTKSMSARHEAIDGCLRHQGYRAIIIRRELEELRRTHLDDIVAEARRICEALGDPKAIKVTAQPPVATFEKTESKIIFGHCKDKGDEEKYLSESYDLFVGDEATQLHWKQIAGIASRLRNDPKINRVARMILTTNPGGPSHHECLEHFITKKVSLDANAFYDPADYQYIKAALWDNPFFMDNDGSFTTYLKRLHVIPDPERRRQLLDGDWGAIVNAFFVAFDPLLHVRAFA
jgi:phage terminase large subunit